MIITVDKFYSEQIHLGKRIAGEVSYPDLQAAVEMADVVERIMVVAGEDPASPKWRQTLREVNTILSLLGAPRLSEIHQVPA